MSRPPPPPPPPRCGNSIPSMNSTTVAMPSSSVSGTQRRRRRATSTSTSTIPSTSTSTSTIPSTHNNSAAGGGGGAHILRRIFNHLRIRISDRKLVIQALIAITVVFFYLRFCSSVLRFSNYDRDEYRYMYSNGNSNSNSNNINKPILLTTNTTISYDSIFCRNNNNNNDSDSDGDKLKRRIRQNKPKGPVFLWGIPSTTSDYETKRRKLLRDTYLMFYKRLHKEEKEKEKKEEKHYSNLYRICSFHDWTCNNNNIREECQMVYVFFVGGGKNDTAPPILLNESITDFRDMLVPILPNATTTTTTSTSSTTSKAATSYDNNKNKFKYDYDFHEPGTVYLDIRENQFDGKMTTWFKFASLVAKELLRPVRVRTRLDEYPCVLR